MENYLKSLEIIGQYIFNSSITYRCSSNQITYWSVQMYIKSDLYAFNESYIQTNVLLKIQTETTKGRFTTPLGTTLGINTQFTFTSNYLKSLFHIKKNIVYF